MESVERVRRLIARQPADRTAIYDSFWWETERDFLLEGMPVGAPREDYFDYDLGMIGFDQSFLLETRILEDREDSRLVVDAWGMQEREFKDHQSTPQLIAFPVSDRAAWDEVYRDRLAYSTERLDWTALRASYAALRARGRYVAFSVIEPFECVWRIVGPQRQLELYIEDPAWLAEMYDAVTIQAEAAWEELRAGGITPDGLWLWGDIAYRAGPMFSPRHYRAVLQPFHARLCALAHRDGAQVIYHTDGDIVKLIPPLVEAGVDCLHPLEVKAGMDVRRLKRDFGDMVALMGNIDARLFQTNDRAALEAEIRDKLAVAKVGGGYLYHSDHSVPPGTTLATYQWALDLVRDVGRYG